jgi:hypothetical protein
MSEGVLDPDRLRILALQAPLAKKRSFFLAGGTALGLRLGHRVSRDLDWFSTTPFDSDELRSEISALEEKPNAFQPGGANTLRAFYGNVETSFITYAQVAQAKKEDLMVGGVAVPVATLELLAIMKAGALINRGTKRDFVDVCAISRQPGWSIRRFIETSANSLAIGPELVVRALSYFADAERDPLPDKCLWSWDEVKQSILAGLRDSEWGVR